MSLRACILFLLAAVGSSAHAIDSIYNWNGLEFVRSGNAHHVHPASPESTRLRGGWVLDISDAEPKATARHPVPFKHQGNAVVTVSPKIDPKKVSARVAQGLKNAAAGAATGNGYVAVGALACGLFDCGSAVIALADWGIDKLKFDDSGVSVDAPDLISDGWRYAVLNESGWYYSADSACTASIESDSSLKYSGWSGDIYAAYCYFTSPSGAIFERAIMVQGSGCPVGTSIHNGQCRYTAREVTQPLQTYLESRYMGKGWDNHWSKMTAEIIKNGGNVFTDGTSVDITGPAIIPVSVSEVKTSVNLVPGTTTPAPVGHTGPTDSGTQTTTTTTTAKNTYKPAPMSPASSGGPATGPSMTTTQETKTTTSITNNVTNITNIVNETTTEKDDAPEENATDTPLTGIPELYKQKYPDGLSGVFNDFKSKINTTSFVQLIGALTPNISGAGSCPSWTIDLTWTPGGSMGRHNIGQDFCWIWPILKIIVMVTALFTVRRLIFGG